MFTLPTILCNDAELFELIHDSWVKPQYYARKCVLVKGTPP